MASQSTAHIPHLLASAAVVLISSPQPEPDPDLDCSLTVRTQNDLLSKKKMKPNLWGEENSGRSIRNTAVIFALVALRSQRYLHTNRIKDQGNK